MKHMDDHLVAEFKQRWPKWFSGLDAPVNQSCLAFGFECGNGWRNLLWALCEGIEQAGADDTFVVERVKEKFGGLRFYATWNCERDSIGADEDAIWKLIQDAENASYGVCEMCGSTRLAVATGNQTKCDKCWLERKQ